MTFNIKEKGTEEPEEEMPPEPEGPPEPEPGSEEWEYIDLPIEKVQVSIVGLPVVWLIMC
jgi:hypothetical protein